MARGVALYLSVSFDEAKRSVTIISSTLYDTRFGHVPDSWPDSAGHSGKLRNPTVRTRMDSVHHVGLRIYRVVLAVVAKVPG